MTEMPTKKPVCVVIGASHAGVNFAFALRKEGWEGEILLYDADPELPYHRPPLSKTYLSNDDGLDKNRLQAAERYNKEQIVLKLGETVVSMDGQAKHIVLADGGIQPYDKLVLATGARPFMPPIRGIDQAKNLFPLRTAADVAHIREVLRLGTSKEVVIIGGGYIGLETAASLRKLGASVTVLEREERVLARVTAPEMSAFFNDLHAAHGVKVFTSKNVVAIEPHGEANEVHCSDGTVYKADLIVVGVGIVVNKELAQQAGLTIDNGIRVDASARTSDESIFAIGDCTYHYNPHYGRYVRLESVQNAVDQAKVAAAAIAGKEPVYDTLPWFWSDQYDVKLQMVGLSQGYNQVLVRKEAENPNSFSVWYFLDEVLLAVDAVNQAKAYVLGTKLIKGGQRIDKTQLADPTVDFKLANLLSESI
ncbi:3-phenylpropionate/trans-cinnamate dioxygenase ferredoxin reductase subunit [Dyadobacter jejuensis]|uniref:3-phenylpropionate/trans-cinnamate dioxygenase ferredoxin reductase subunit n=2 Tax=Dyadobacter jejuensis TaxID=1082580 RepID=A0A316ARG8_9BACT|nr:3-phenylpropionate/trans-cinnamate dioxygenase ferredoxin reductase subunit [Dyadobacter jejuensis]